MSIDDKEFKQLGDVLAKLTEKPEVFKKVVEALEKNDPKQFQAELRRLKLLRYCRIFCRWHCHIVCVRFLRRVCIEPPIELREIEAMRGLSVAHSKIMLDKELRDSLFAAYEKEDVEKFQAILKRYELHRYCWYIVQWLCWYRCWLLCYRLCFPLPIR